jgi:hypothetical protein
VYCLGGGEGRGRAIRENNGNIRPWRNSYRKKKITDVIYVEFYTLLKVDLTNMLLLSKLFPS